MTSSLLSTQSHQTLSLLCPTKSQSSFPCFAFVRESCLIPVSSLHSTSFVPVHVQQQKTVTNQAFFRVMEDLGQNSALHASPTARSFFLYHFCVVHSTIFSPKFLINFFLAIRVAHASSLAGPRSRTGRYPARRHKRLMEVLSGEPAHRI